MQQAYKDIRNHDHQNHWRFETPVCMHEFLKVMKNTELSFTHLSTFYRFMQNPCECDMCTSFTKDLQIHRS